MNDAHDDGYEQIEQCLGCLIGDEEVERCAAEGCDVYLHKHCGAGCEACGKPICDAHVTVVGGDSPVCPVCLPEILRIAAEERRDLEAA